MMRYVVRAGDEEIPVTVEDDGAVRRVSLRGREYRVDLVEVVPGWYSLIVDGRSHRLGALGDRSGAAGPPDAPGAAAWRWALELDGAASTVEVMRGGARPSGGPADRRAGRGEVRAPMPGLVVAVQVTEGARVAARQPLVIMEAMKMQMEIRSPGPGVVGRVHVAPGQEVGGGQVLVTLAHAKDSPE